MWILLFLGLAVINDYLKPPIDKLYFQNPLRPLVGIRNTLIDLFFSKSHYEIDDFPGLWLIKDNFSKILNEYKELHPNLKKHYLHDLDSWFPENYNYYLYKSEDFPFLNNLLKSIPSVAKANITVMDGPVNIPPHRAETNMILLYHMTLEGESTLQTLNEFHKHSPSEEFIFDPAKWHACEKKTSGKRAVLMIHLNRDFRYI